MEKKKRSRSGCYTCRSRRKRCPQEEARQPDGTCDRCFRGGWDCVWPSPEPARPPKRRIGRRGSAAEASQAQPVDAAPTMSTVSGTTGAETTSAAQPTPSSSCGPRFLPATTSLDELAPSSSSFSSPQHAHSLSLPPIQALPHTRPSAPSLEADIALSGPSTATAGLLDDGLAKTFSLGMGEDVDSFFSSLDWDLGSWAGASEQGLEGDVLGAPVDARAEAAGGEEGQFPLATFPFSSAGDFQPPAGVADPSEQDAAISLLGFLAEPAQGDAQDLDLRYNVVNSGYFRSLPEPARQAVCSQIYDIAVSSSLGRCAGMSMVMLYRLRLQQRSTATDASRLAESEEWLLAQSHHFFRCALEHIQTPIPLDAKIVATLDLQTQQFDQHGAAAANAMLLLGECFVKQDFGPTPSLDLATASIPLLTFLWADCLRCICIPGRRPVFALPSLPGDLNDSSTLVQGVTDVACQVQVHLGLPVGLMLALCAVANLAVAKDALPAAVVDTKAAAIEQAIRTWTPPPPDAHELAEGLGYLDRVRTAEQWRQASLIHLYQAVHQHGALSPVLRQARREILTIAAGVFDRLSSRSTSSASPRPPAHDDYIGSHSVQAVPLFLAGTVTHSVADRELVLRGLEHCGVQKGYRDAASALEFSFWTLDDYDAISAKLDALGGQLDFRKYEEALFQLLLVGAVLAPGGNPEESGVGRSVFSIASTGGDSDKVDVKELRKAVGVFERLMRRYKYLQYDFEESALKSILGYAGKFTPIEQQRLAAATALFVQVGLAPAATIGAVCTAYLIKEGTAQTFFLLDLETYASTGEAIDPVLVALRKAGLADLEQFFPARTGWAGATGAGGRVGAAKVERGCTSAK